MDNIRDFLLILWIMKWHLLFVVAFFGTYFWYENRGAFDE